MRIKSLSARVQNLITQNLIILILALGILFQAGCAFSIGSSGGSGPAGPVITVTPPTVGAMPSTPSAGFGTPQVPSGAPGLTPHLSGTPAFTTADVAQYVMSHPIPGALADGSAPVIIRNDFLPSEVVAGLVGHAPLLRPAGTLLSYVELRGTFSFPGADDGQALSYPIAYEIFDARTGNFVEYGGLSAPTSTPTSAAAATATPAAPPQLSVSPPGTTDANCSTLPITYPTVTVKNAGGQVLTWQVTATNAHVTISPASGSLSAGKSQMLAVSQASGSGGTDLNFNSNGGSAKITFECIVV